MKKTEQQIFLVKIMHAMIEKLREFNFDINDHKYLFVSSKILEKVYEMHEKEIKMKDEENNKLKDQITTKEGEVEKVKAELNAQKVEEKIKIIENR